jgi:hypothetical protein
MVVDCRTVCTLRVRSKGAAIATVSNWLFNFVSYNSLSAMNDLVYVSQGDCPNNTNRYSEPRLEDLHQLRTLSFHSLLDSNSTGS